MQYTSAIKICLLSSIALTSACGGGGGDGGGGTPEVISFDCTDGPQCPAISISGDPVYVLPNNAPSPFSGHADPSIRKDPDSDRLWMSYSYVGIHAEDSGDPAAPIITPYVSIHLAHSDDNGSNWVFDKNIWESSAGIDQGTSSDAGFSIHEVSTITPFVSNNATQWLGLHLRYFLKRGDSIDKRLPNSFHYRFTQADSPVEFGNTAEAVLTNPLTAPGWGSDINLSQLAPELNDCDLWAEPTLFPGGDKLYLIAECLKIDESVVPAARLYDEEFNGVFVTNMGDDVRQFNWQWLGKITDNSVAAQFNSRILTQVDIARARDGSLLLIVTPTDDTGGTVIAHKGCRVLEIASLDPPQLVRQPDGMLKVRAEITSSDIDSAGLCAYDAASDTGVVLVRTRIDRDTPQLFWQLHATGVHP